MTNWRTRDVTRFKREAREEHKKYYDLLGKEEWHVITAEDWTTLRNKVEFSMYGPFGLTITSTDRLHVTEKICSQLVNEFSFEKENIHFSCIFVFMKVYEKRFTVPVFKSKRVLDSNSQCVYVDTNARKYNSWNDYLNYNTLPKCIYCYPADGVYETYDDDDDDDVIVRFGTSPACDFVCRVCRFFDITSTVVNLATFVIGIATLCTIPISGPVMDATTNAAGILTNVYGVSRSLYGLYDRATHSQSLSLVHFDARGGWLSIVVSSLEFTQGQMIASMSNAARAGQVTGVAGRIAFMIVQSGSFITNLIGIVHGIAVITRSERNELKPLDVFQFSASVMFFMNTAINFKTASTVIKEVQSNFIMSHRDSLSENFKKMFDNQTARLLEPNDMYETAKVVKQLIEGIENWKILTN